MSEKGKADFSVARALLALLAFLGWITAGLAVLGGGMVLGDGGGLAAVWPAGLGVLAGLALVAVAQMGRAQIVTAEAAQDIREILRAERS